LKPVCHITTVHPVRDTRIFYKECKSLARAGYKVTLIVINGESFTEDGVEVMGVPCHFAGRLSRFFRASDAAYRKALEVNADLYHFHDPEFLPWASRLIKKGKKVIYDVHEDLPRQMLSKYWIIKPIRKIGSWIAERIENYYARKMTRIITVTDHIGNRFSKFHPNVHLVRNFPVLKQKKSGAGTRSPGDQVFYVGSITPERGVTGLVDAIELVRNNVTLNLAGIFNREQYRQELLARKGWKRVNEIGFADRQKVDDLMQSSFAGLVTLHPIPNYPDALPVKMFEYMAAGLPVIASDFPLWREIIEGHHCGICVDPLNPKEIAAAIDRLYEDPAMAQEMGQNGKKAAEEKYNWVNEEKVLLDTYNEIINGRK
jgi:glycosyltransferase involved in cell wall biosynthesis